MPTLRFSKKICRQIVRNGQETVLDNQIYTRICPRSLGLRYGGHLVGTIHSSLSPVLFDVIVGENHYRCYAPLLRTGYVLATGLKVIIQRNLATRHWEIIAAECEEE